MVDTMRLILYAETNSNIHSFTDGLICSYIMFHIFSTVLLFFLLKIGQNSAIFY